MNVPVSRLAMSCPKISYDGLYHCRFPQGIQYPGAISGGATVASAVSAILSTGIKLSGSPSESISATGALGGTGAALVFSYPSGFAGSFPAIRTANGAQLVGSNINLCSFSTLHTAGGAWFTTQQTITSFTTNFTFQFQTGIQAGTFCGFVFCVQNSNATSNPGGVYGTNATGDANVCGYGCYDPAIYGSGQMPIGNSIGVKFDISGNGANGYPLGATPNATGLYINGGTYSTLSPGNDMRASGINLWAGNVMACKIVYDGSLLTMVLRDTVTGAQFRMSWPVNIPACTGSNNCWVGFAGGNASGSGATNPAGIAILTWDFSTGYNTRLATPTFSPTPGSYTTSQTVTISGPVGASIYYTTDGRQPTSADTPYTGPINVSSSEYIQAVAILSGYTDSLVGSANYQIATAGSPIVNLPSGFSGTSLITYTGCAKLTGSQIQLTDTNSRGSEVGNAWYAAPVGVNSFTCNFTLQFTSASANGLTFIIQNQPATSQDASGIMMVSGGNNALGSAQNALGYGAVSYGTGTNAGKAQYQGLQNSIAVKFDVYQSNSTGLYTNGLYPGQTSNQIPITGVTLNSGHPLACSLSYDGTTLALSITDTVTLGHFSVGWTVNIPSIVGGGTAYIGFGAATGGAYANQFVNSLTYAAS